jgi:hypothetical protein
MKNETKLKIIRWVTKCLKYKDTERINPFAIESQSIITASSQHLYDVEKMELLNKNNMIETVLTEDIVKSLLALHAIKIDRGLVFFQDQEMIKVTGTLKFIMP